MNIKERFMAKVDQSADCWIWTARKTPQGYGRFSLHGVNKLAHRVAFELFQGPIGGLHVLHRCDNPSCVNPDHLWLGTNADNVADKVVKGRTPDLAGSRNPNSKLSAEDVLEIRCQFMSGVGRAELAKRYGVCAPYINQIATKKVWRQI